MSVPGRQDYRIIAPADVLIPAACQDVSCPKWRHGFDLAADERTGLGRRRAAYVRSGAHRREYRELGTDAGGVTVFRFSSGQRCFDEHRTRPQRLLVRGAVNREHVSAADWLDDAGQHFDRLISTADRG